MQQIYGFAGRGGRTLRGRFIPFLYEKTMVRSPTYNSLGPATDMLLHGPAQLCSRFLHVSTPPVLRRKYGSAWPCQGDPPAPRPKGGEMGDGCS